MLLKVKNAVGVDFWEKNDPEPKSVGLIIPPSAFLLDERVFVSLGVLKIASALEARGHRVSVLDLSGIENYLDALDHYLEESTDEVLGITSTTPQLPAVFAIARRIREVRPDVKRILGGPHATLAYSAKRVEQKNGVTEGRGAKAVEQLEGLFDVVVAGDGEIAIFDALKDGAPRLVDGDDSAGPYFLSNELYNASPFPSRALVDMDSYRYSIEEHRATSLIAQLGCPFSCGFCGGRNSRSLRIIRTRSVESIVAEMEHLHRRYGYTGFMFYDDELNVSKGMVELMNAICDLQERLGVEFRLRGFVKAELFTEEQAAAMRRAGFRWLLCGYEAAHGRILSNIKKRATLEDNTRCVELAKAADLKVKALMSVGHPGETAETIASIETWLCEVGVDDFDCTIITTYPGTPYYDLAVPHATLPGVYTYTDPTSGDRLHAHDLDFAITPDYYKGDPEDGYKSFVFTDALSAAEIVAQRDSVERAVRKRLGIPFNPARASVRYEHSMGQGLPDFILRTAKQGQG
jgi:radical SAM superfamily enzyme YgiQ (UPF0313 family)